MIWYFVIAILVLCSTASNISADSRDKDFDYDIFTINDTIAIWLDITPVLDQQKMEDLLSGLEIHIGLEIKLEKPKRFLPPEELIGRRFTLQISHKLTEDNYCLRISESSSTDYEFDNQPGLYDYLADSLVFNLLSRAGLKAEESCRLNLKIACKSLYPKNKTNGSKLQSGSRSITEDNENSLIQSLFSTFLEVFGFGKSYYRIISPTFIPAELP